MKRIVVVILAVVLSGGATIARTGDCVDRMVAYSATDGHTEVTEVEVRRDAEQYRRMGEVRQRR